MPACAHAQHSWSSMAVVIRTPAGPPQSLLPFARRCGGLNADAVVISVRPFMFHLTRSVFRGPDVDPEDLALALARHAYRDDRRLTSHAR